MSAVPTQRSGMHLVTEPVKPPIANIGAEAAILGCLLVDPGAFTRIEGLLQPEHFYSSAHRHIFESVINLNGQGKRSDLVQVASDLQDRKLLEACGGQIEIARMAEKVISTANVDQYALLVRDKWTRRQILRLGSSADTLAYSPETTEEVVGNLRDQVDELSGVSGSDWVSLQEIADQLLSSSQDRINGISRDMTPSGFYDLDQMMAGGFEGGEVVVIAGRPAMGKSAFALAMASKMAAKVPVGFYSMEMSREALGRRLVASDTGIWGSELKTMQMSDPRRIDKALQGICDLANGKELYMRFNQPSLEELVNDVQSAISRFGLKAVFIDHLHLMPGSEDATQLAKISNRLARMCRTTGVNLFELCQLSRGVESRTNKRPTMADLKQTSALEQDADKILMLYRDEYYNPETVDRGIAEVICVKHRDGPTGTVKLLFEPQFSRFNNLAQGY